MPVMLPTRKAHKLALRDLKYELEKALKEFDERTLSRLGTYVNTPPEARFLLQVRSCVVGAVSACAIACDLLGEEPPGRDGHG